MRRMIVFTHAKQATLRTMRPETIEGKVFQMTEVAKVLTPAAKRDAEMKVHGFDRKSIYMRASVFSALESVARSTNKTVYEVLDNVLMSDARVSKAAKLAAEQQKAMSELLSK